MRHVPVEVKEQFEEVIQEDPTYCEICGECDREDRMLLCDGCDLGYHMECLQPQLYQVPLDEWFCSECSQNMQNDAEVVSVIKKKFFFFVIVIKCFVFSSFQTQSDISKLK